MKTVGVVWFGRVLGGFGDLVKGLWAFWLVPAAYALHRRSRLSPAPLTFRLRAYGTHWAISQGLKWQVLK